VGVAREYLKAAGALAIFAAVLWLAASFELVLLPSSATRMAPAVRPGTRYLLRQSSGRAEEFAHADVVFFSFIDPCGPDARKVFASRVVGLPGERVALFEGKLVRNGKEVPEPYLVSPGCGRLEEIVIPRGHLYVLNDERAPGGDSRSLGPIPATAVLGRVRR
jgi:signal peptidase I